MDPLILVGSIAGIALMVAVNWALLRGRTPARLTADAVAERLAADFIGYEAHDITFANGGKAALARSRDGRGIALTILMGDRMITRLLSPGVLRSVAAHGNASLRIRFEDFTLPAASLTFDDAETGRKWAEALADLARD